MGNMLAKWGHTAESSERNLDREADDESGWGRDNFDHGSETTSNMWYQIVNVQGKRINFLVDTGAVANVLPRSIFRDLMYKDVHISPCTIGLTTYGGGHLKNVGTVFLMCSAGNIKTYLKFTILDADTRCALLGLTGCLDLNLITRNHILKRVDSSGWYITPSNIPLHLAKEEEGNRAQSVEDATDKDALLSQVKKYVLSQWPSKKEDTLPMVKFRKHREQLSIHKGMIFFDDRLVVPRVLRKIFIMELHKIGHGRVSTTIRYAKHLYFWLRMEEDIMDYMLTGHIRPDETYT